MVKVKKFNLNGKKVGDFQPDTSLLEAKAHSQMSKDYIVAIRENMRQWSASTKTRSEVKHTTRKPHPQKGTGNARQGSLVAPQFRGGGIVFGPKPKFDQHVRINKKERRAVIKSLIAEKIKDDKVVLIESTEMEQPKTKSVAEFLKNCGIEKRVLFIGEGEYHKMDIDGTELRVSLKTTQHENFVKSLRNIKKAEFSLAMNVNGYDLMKAQYLVMTESALEEITEWLK